MPASIPAARSIFITSTPKPLEAGDTGSLAGMDAILVPGGFGKRGVEGKIAAIRYAREKRIPYLGICLGMQLAVIEYARHKAGMADAHSTEFEPDTPHPVVALITEWRTKRRQGRNPQRAVRSGRHHAPGRAGSLAAGRLAGAQGLWRRKGHRAPSPPL